MKDKIKHLIGKYRTALLYLLFGTLTTILSIILFYIANAILGEEHYLLSNLISWLVAVIFAFLTNKHAVFKSRSKDKATLTREILEFLIARIVSLGAEEAGLWLLLDVIGLSGVSFTLLFTVTGTLISKVIVTAAVIILNYLFSKFIIFKPRES